MTIPILPRGWRCRFLLAGMAASFVAAVVLCNGWIDEDANITFRTVDNFVRGYGLRFNISERVQSFTHPLWLFFVSIAYSVTHEFDLTVMFLSCILTGISVYLLLARRAASGWVIVPSVIVLVLSRSFIHYSTSGLENALAHCILAAFSCFIASKNTLRITDGALLAALASTAALNRLDHILFFIPALFVFVIHHRSLRALMYVGMGFLPLAAWIVFSVVYYGFPFPNTYYAKVGVGISTDELIRSGLFYLYHSFIRDPITLTTICSAFIVAVLSRSQASVLIALGILLHLGYVVSIGGDYMCGRFLSAGFFLALGVLHLLRWTGYRALGFSVLAIVIGSQSINIPLFISTHYGKSNEAQIVDPFDQRVNDKHLRFYPWTGFLNRVVDRPLSFEPLHRDFGSPKLGFRYALNSTILHTNINEHIIDDLGLVDALIARLPTLPNWLPGHYLRMFPAGYSDLKRTGGGSLCDPSLHAYLAELTHVISGPLWSMERFVGIFMLNTGQYSRLINRDFYGANSPVEMQFSELETGIQDFCTQLIPTSGVHVRFASIMHDRAFFIELDSGEPYYIEYYNEQTLVGRTSVGDVGCGALCEGPRFINYSIQTPQSAIDKGFNRLSIVPPDNSNGSPDRRAAIRSMKRSS